jgi:outer membrane murein-binding lipoprotein Lpp
MAGSSSTTTTNTGAETLAELQAKRSALASEITALENALFAAEDTRVSHFVQDRINQMNNLRQSMFNQAIEMKRMGMLA